MSWWYIAIGIVLLWIIFYKIKKTILHRSAIGQKVTVVYADHNYHFKAIFPKIGIIRRKLKIEKGHFFILDLEDPFYYEGNIYKTIIIKERHLGRYIGSKSEIDVHVLLPKINLNRENYTLGQFHHVVWASIISNT